jgi:hypothetical protein
MATGCGMTGEAIVGTGRPGGVNPGGGGGNGMGMGNIACGPIGSGGCGIIPIAAGWYAPNNGSDDGITMMIAVLFASLFTNGQPQPILVALVLPLQQHSPLLPHSHLLSLQQVQFAPHFFALQQQSLLSLQLHLPPVQQLRSLSTMLPVKPLLELTPTPKIKLLVLASLTSTLMSLKTPSPPLLHSHLFSLQQEQLASHFLPAQQDSPSLQHFPSLQHAPVAQQPLPLPDFSFVEQAAEEWYS